MTVVDYIAITVLIGGLVYTVALGSASDPSRFIFAEQLGR